MRRYHYWQKPTTTALPSNLLFFDSETKPESESSNETAVLHRLRLGFALAFRREGEKRTREAEIVYHTADAFWGFVVGRLSADRPLWVFAHNIAFDLGTVRGWGFIASDACKWSRVAIDNPIFFMKGLIHGKPVVLVDSFNYWRCSLAVIGKSIGREKQPMPDFGASERAWHDYCRNDVEVLADGVCSLLQFWREHQLGPWGPTISTLAFNAFRTRYMGHSILVHGDADLLALERSSYYGGRVDTPLIGVRHTGPVFETDVNSLYPWACQQRLPTQPLAHVKRNAHLALSRLDDDKIYIADVEIKTDEKAFPCRMGGRLYHATGSFRCALADAELRVAMETGTVRRVFRAGVFASARIFENYVHHFWDLKNQYEREGNEGWRQIAKSLLTNLYGKTGQLTPKWVCLNKEGWQRLESQEGMPVGSLKRYYKMRHDMDEFDGCLVIPELPQPIKLRCLWGETEMNVGRAESRDSVPSIAACVTSIGRVRLTELQTIAGDRNWLYSDTDSVWCTESGLANLEHRGEIVSGVCGKLALKRTYDSLLVHGRKDYEAGDVKRAKGVRDPYHPEDDGRFKQMQFPSLTTQLRDNEPNGVILRTILKQLRRVPDHCHVGKGGWTRPLVFPQDLPDNTDVPRCR